MREPVADSEPVRREDLLEVGRETGTLRERWRALPPRRRRLVAAVALALIGVLTTARLDAERPRAEREAVVDLDARLLRTGLLTDRQSLGFSLRLSNWGPAPVRVERGYVGVAGVGLLDAPLDPVLLSPGHAEDLVVQWGFPQCRVLAGSPVTVTGLVLDLRTADTDPRRAQLPVPGPRRRGPAVGSGLPCVRPRCASRHHARLRCAHRQCAKCRVPVR